MLLRTDNISSPVIGISDVAVINCPVVWEDACIKRAPIRAWYPINPNKIPNKSSIKPLFINLLVCPLEGLELLAIALPVLTINQPCHRLKSSKIKDIVVSDRPGASQAGLRYYLQHLKKAKQLQQQHLK